MLRRSLFWLHLVAGLAAGAVILIMSVTGVLLTYESQLTRWADGFAVHPKTAGAAPLGVEDLTRRVHDARGTWPSAVTLRADESRPAEFSFGRETTFVDPYSGVVLGNGSQRARAFFRGVTDWHRWLGATGPERETARALTGASNLAFLLIVVSGLFLWWPARFTGRQLRPITWFLARAKGRARDFNWHHVFGIWALVPLLFVVTSGVVISYPWANQMLQRAVGAAPESRGAARGPGPGVSADATRDASIAGADQAFAVARAHAGGWQSISLRLPEAAVAPWVFSIDTSSGARRPDTRTQLTLGRESMATIEVVGYDSVPVGRKAIGWNRFIHTGEAFGVIGQTVAGLASLSAIVLVWTGAALSLRRFGAWRRRRRPSAPIAA